ncbi:MAG: hypothetical protein IJ387_11435 [Thermoguttaceae bacterium]|nr:hypothetical protein [Thermoguttaceae bacterium]
MPNRYASIIPFLLAFRRGVFSRPFSLCNFSAVRLFPSKNINIRAAATTHFPLFLQTVGFFKKFLEKFKKNSKKGILKRKRRFTKDEKFVKIKRFEITQLDAPRRLQRSESLFRGAGAAENNEKSARSQRSKRETLFY